MGADRWWTGWQSSHFYPYPPLPLLTGPVNPRICPCGGVVAAAAVATSRVFFVCKDPLSRDMVMLPMF